MVIDFEYDGVKLSDLGYAIVSFDDVKGGEINTDSQITFNHFPMMHGKHQPFSSYIYEDVLEMELYIAKNMCPSDDEEPTYTISVEDMAYLKRWLSRPTPHKLTLTGNNDYNGIFWRGSFKVEEYVVGGKRIGAHLMFECDAPFGYKDKVTLSGYLAAMSVFGYNCTSDEIGWIYPKLTITVRNSGDLSIGNTRESGRQTVINNCVAGEIITFTENMQVHSSIQSHNVMDDFNFIFYRVCNSFDNTLNGLVSSLDIDYELEYTPYAKAVIV